MSSDKPPDQWIFAHVGARDHFAAARALHASGRLALLATDYWIPFAKSVQSCFPKSLKRISKRFHDELQNAQVIAFNLGSATDAIIVKSRHLSVYDRWIFYGSRFCNRTIGALRNRANSTAKYLCGYTCANLELTRYARDNGHQAVHMQIDPGKSYYDTRRAEWERYPDFEAQPETPTASFLARINQEWSEARYVIVNSAYSLQCLVDQGVDEKKIHVVPLSYSAPDVQPGFDRFEAPSRLEVLWVGNINLVKGFHYFAEAARELSGAEFHFSAAGIPHLNRAYISRCEQHIDFKGHLPFAELNQLYERCHVLVFPTLSDGFGLVQLEAMSHGLPVVCTPHCGQVVQDGVNGFVVPIRSSASIVEKLQFLKNNPEALCQMAMNAYHYSRKYDLQAYATQLLSAVSG